MRKLRQFVGIVVSGIKGFIKEPDCKTCEALRDWLDEEKAKRDFYEKLFLQKVGVFAEETKEEAEIEYPSVNRVTTLSSLRRQARQIQHSRRQIIDEVAPKAELTEAEIQFEEALNGK